ncbi:iron complex transport system substrate-binding protein [Paucibacter oligotrophus]|uniref:Iron complex transport system substrate-binding protein n=1 Tax=Roseateles oligotrophus TaxID=1769250 RepID=A0A840LAM8_9BURK|nr:ABC transporter substrate-binding protein [Roseateles oligotrophus]MBB4845230.1 iron complex transport system substrate-binding protein [Roseateles oligotrophus]
MLNRRVMSLGLAAGLALPLSGRAQPAGRKVQDALGRSQTLPTQASRVLALSERDLDAALALGLKPVAATLGRAQAGFPPYLAARAEGVASLGQFANPSMDRVLAARPDLILAGGLADAKLFAQLERIAPTVSTYRGPEPWTQSLQQLAAWLGREPAGADCLQRYQTRVAGLRQRLAAQQGRSVSLVRWTPQGPTYMKGQAFAGLLLGELGLLRPPRQQEPGAGHSAPLSSEALGEIDADWLLIGMFGSGAGHDPQALQALLKQPEFRELRAARAGRVRQVDAALWTVTGGPLAAMAVLDDVERLMLAAA